MCAGRGWFCGASHSLAKVSYFKIKSYVRCVYTIYPSKESECICILERKDFAPERFIVWCGVMYAHVCFFVQIVGLSAEILLS